MVKSNAVSVKVDKSPRHVRNRKAVRVQFLATLKIVDRDENEIDHLVDQYLARAAISGEHAAQNRRDRESRHKFLAEAAALFLVASESDARASRLAGILHARRIISKHEDTTLLSLILKGLGPYPRYGRQEVNRDSTVLKFLFECEVMPGDIPSYLETKGQGIQSTYLRAVAVFNAHKSTRPVKCPLRLQSQLQAKLAKCKSGQRVISVLTINETGLVMNGCVTDPSLVKAVTDFIKAMLNKKRI